VLGQSCCVFVPVLSLLCYLRIITFVVHINYFQCANSGTLLLSYHFDNRRTAVSNVVGLGRKALEVPLWKETCYLSENVLSEMHICPNFDLGAKVRISKVRQGFLNLLCCA